VWLQALDVRCVPQRLQEEFQDCHFAPIVIIKQVIKRILQHNKNMNESFSPQTVSPKVGSNQGQHKMARCTPTKSGEYNHDASLAVKKEHITVTLLSQDMVSSRSRSAAWFWNARRMMVADVPLIQSSQAPAEEE
jgi:hypothetical protein